MVPFLGFKFEIRTPPSFDASIAKSVKGLYDQSAVCILSHRTASISRRAAACGRAELLAKRHAYRATTVGFSD